MTTVKIIKIYEIVIVSFTNIRYNPVCFISINWGQNIFHYYDTLLYLETKRRINSRARALELVDNVMILRGSILIDKPRHRRIL